LSNSFSYSAAGIANVEAALSIERFSSYLAKAPDPGIALKLYEWNSTMSAAFYIPIQSVEIGLRNGFHRELTRVFGSSWHDAPAFRSLNVRFGNDVEEAKMYLRRTATAVDTPHIVARLPFGFWTTMLSRRYEHALWTPGLRGAFPRFGKLRGRTPSRNEVAARFDYVREFRNRIAHHEPIFYRDLAADYASLLEIARWMYEDLANWTDGFCGCSRLLAAGMPGPVISKPGGWAGPAFGVPTR
jgi:hypothetical protein